MTSTEPGRRVVETRVVVDASAAVVLGQADSFGRVDMFALSAPHLLWSECRSCLHRAARRGQLGEQAATDVLERIASAAIEPIDMRESAAVTDIARLLGWHKTYDAEYLAAAREREALLLTFDRAMRAGAGRVGVELLELA